MLRLMCFVVLIRMLRWFLSRLLAVSLCIGSVSSIFSYENGDFTINMWSGNLIVASSGGLFIIETGLTSIYFGDLLFDLLLLLLLPIDLFYYGKAWIRLGS